MKSVLDGCYRYWRTTTLFWGNNVDGNTAEIQAGEIYYTIDDELGKLIAISYDSLEVTNDLVATHFGFSATEISNTVLIILKNPDLCISTKS